MYVYTLTQTHTNYDKTPFTSLSELYNIKVGKHSRTNTYTNYIIHFNGRVYYIFRWFVSSTKR